MIEKILLLYEIKKEMKKITKSVLKMNLHWQILMSIVFAVAFGLFFPEFVKYIDWLGDLFMRALKMIVVPLIITSMVSGIVNLSSEQKIGKLGIGALFYIFSTTLIAVLLGLFFVNTFQPGVGCSISTNIDINSLNIQKITIKDILLEIIPSNIFESMWKGELLPVIVFSLLFGFFITKVESSHNLLLRNFFNAGFEVIMKLTQFIIKLAPIGIFALISKVVSSQNDIWGMVLNLGKFVLVVLLGFSVQFFIVLPLIVLFIGKINPIKFYKKIFLVFLTAFSTASSAATLSVSMEVAKNELKISNRIAGFMLPLGATLNMNGTALYELVVVFFIAQVYGIELSMMQQIIIVLLSLLTAIGAAGIPMASLVMISVILLAVGLPAEGIALVLAVDRPLDMLRTIINVTGDMCGSIVLARFSGEKIKVN